MGPPTGAPPAVPFRGPAGGAVPSAPAQTWTGAPPQYAATTGDERVNPAWIWGAIVCAVLASAYIAFVPTVNELPGELVVNDDGTLVRKFDQETNLQAHVWAIVLIPLTIALAALPLFSGGTTRSVVISGIALVAIAVVTGFWFGIVFAPAAVLLLLGAAVIELKPVRQNMEARLQGL